MHEFFVPFVNLEIMGPQVELHGDWISANNVLIGFLLEHAKFPDIDKFESWNPKGMTFKIKDDTLAVMFKLKFADVIGKRI
jgi:hypothetical protein